MFYEHVKCSCRDSLSQTSTLNSTPHATAEVVTAALVDYLQGKGLSLDRLARGYCDGAAIMLGAHSGVAARLKELVHSYPC